MLQSHPPTLSRPASYVCLKHIVLLYPRSLPPRVAPAARPPPPPTHPTTTPPHPNPLNPAGRCRHLPGAVPGLGPAPADEEAASPRAGGSGGSSRSRAAIDPARHAAAAAKAAPGSVNRRLPGTRRQSTSRSTELQAHGTFNASCDLPHACLVKILMYSLKPPCRSVSLEVHWPGPFTSSVLHSGQEPVCGCHRGRVGAREGAWQG